jgi:desulfoferrodoxin (superoxide reductase-like protein)
MQWKLLQSKHNKRRNKTKMTSTEAEDSTHNSKHVRKVKVKGENESKKVKASVGDRLQKKSKK